MKGCSVQSLLSPRPNNESKDQHTKEKTGAESQLSSDEPQNKLPRKQFDVLCQKLDDLSLSIKSIKLHDTQGPPQPIRGNQAKDEVNWKEIHNIAELTQCIPAMRFYPGDAAQRSPSVIRCEICYELLKSRFLGNCEGSVEKVALRGIGRYAGSLSSGLLLPTEKSEQVIVGGNAYWYRTKQHIKSHLGCAGENSTLHYEAMQHAVLKKKREARGKIVTNNIVKIALSVIKSKSAAKSFEQEIAAHISTGSDLGDLGHSRNHFNEIMAAMQVWLDEQTASFLAKPLPSTNFLPHFFITADKSTPQRLSNQAIMMCPMSDGIRVAIPVDAPLVYKPEKDGPVGKVSGANADQLAKQIIHTIQLAYGDNPGFDLKLQWQGTACDGQYQATEFGKTLFKELGVKADPMFSEVIWDPSHWLNLAILDIRDDKVGSSGSFLKAAINRSKNVHAMFQRGKMLSSAVAIAQSQGVKLRMLQGNCATRFWSSQYQQFCNILANFGIYAEAFREFGYNEIKEFEILGRDFVIDLCMIVDVMEIFVKLMVRVQSLSAPCWKICIWWQRAKSWLEELRKEDIENPPDSLKQLSKHISEIIDKSEFNGQHLVDGWKVVSRDDDVENWVVRDPADCKDDFEMFVGDLIEAVDRRYHKCVAGMCDQLTCLDIEVIISLLCGERRNGKPAIDEIKLEEYGRDGFKEFVTYVCSQEHVKTAIDDGLLDIHPGLAHVLHRKLKQAMKMMLWERKDIMGRWFLMAKKGGKCLSEELTKDARCLQAFSMSENKESLDLKFIMKFSGDERMYEVLVNEKAIMQSFYTDADVYEELGREICLIIDIALAKGGPESVVESFYSVVKCQQKHGGQLNENLSLRAKLDWSLPNILHSEKMVEKVAALYLNGNREKGLKKHALPIIGDRNPYKRSKVLDRLESSDVRLPYLL